MRSTILNGALCAWSLVSGASAIVYGERPTAASPATTTTTTTGYKWGGHWSKPTGRPDGYILASNKPKPGTTYGLLKEYDEGCGLRHSTNNFRLDDVEPDLSETRTAIKTCATVCSSGKNDPTMDKDFYKTTCDFVYVTLSELEDGPRWVCHLEYAPYVFDADEDVLCEKRFDEVKRGYAFKNDRMP